MEVKMPIVAESRREDADTKMLKKWKRRGLIMNLEQRRAHSTFHIQIRTVVSARGTLYVDARRVVWLRQAVSPQ